MEGALRNGKCLIDDKLVDSEVGRKYDCKFSWPGTKTTTRNYCLLQKGIVTVRHNGFPFSDLGDIGSCDYKDGFCITPSKIHVAWTPSPVYTQEYIPAYHFKLKVVRLQGPVIMPSIQLSLTLKKEVKPGIWDKEQGFRVKLASRVGDEPRKISARALLSTLEP